MRALRQGREKERGREEEENGRRDEPERRPSGKVVCGPHRHLEHLELQQGGITMDTHRRLTLTLALALPLILLLAAQAQE